VRFGALRMALDCALPFIGKEQGQIASVDKSKAGCSAPEARW
jgi:hypothetical protein